jgi:hypothetical protein
VPGVPAARKSLDAGGNLVLLSEHVEILELADSTLD